MVPRAGRDVALFMACYRCWGGPWLESLAAFDTPRSAWRRGWAASGRPPGAHETVHVLGRAMVVQELAFHGTAI